MGFTWNNGNLFKVAVHIKCILLLFFLHIVSTWLIQWGSKLKNEWNFVENEKSLSNAKDLFNVTRLRLTNQGVYHLGLGLEFARPKQIFLFFFFGLMKVLYSISIVKWDHFNGTKNFTRHFVWLDNICTVKYVHAGMFNMLCGSEIQV